MAGASINCSGLCRWSLKALNHAGEQEKLYKNSKQ